MRPIHYLESLDSVRAPVRLVDDRVPGISQEQVDQAAAARCEALVALAFGRDIVIPQSYALDSFACQALVRTVAAAERTIGMGRDDFSLQHSRALRLHLFGPSRFVDAASAMFARVGDARWTSSLYSDFSRTDRAAELADALSGGQAANPLEWVPDWRADLFGATWEYFRSAQRGDERRVVEAHPFAGPTLEEGVRRFVSRELESDQPRSSVSRVAEQIARLIDLSPDDRPFQGRSRIHGPEPWTGRPGEPCARELVGDSVLMHQVLEVVDTLYNQVVVDSIGRSFATYTTRVGPWSEVEHEGVVQDEALEVSGSGNDSVRGAPFEIAIEKPSLDRALRVIPSLLAPAAFAEVLAARESTEWTKSFQRLEEARRGTNADRVRAVHQHTRLLAKALDGQANVEVDDGSGVWVEVKGAALEVMATGPPALLAVFNPWLGLSAPLPLVGARMWRAVQTRRGFELRHGALGKLVEPRTEKP